MSYAQNTTVPVERSKGEIEKLLMSRGARAFGYVVDTGQAQIAFKLEGRSVRISLPLPDPDSEEFWETEARRRKRTREQASALWEKACRSRWRALLLIIKAKLEAVDLGITSFDHEFMADVVTPNGQTVFQWLRPQLEDIYSKKKMPKMLPGV